MLSGEDDYDDDVNNGEGDDEVDDGDDDDDNDARYVIHGAERTADDDGDQ